MSAAWLQRWANAELEAARPKTRADCQSGPRPCPWVSCKWHLGHTYGPKLNREGKDDGRRAIRIVSARVATDLPTCALDVADEGPASYAKISHALGISAERARHISDRAMDQLSRSAAARRELAYFLEIGGCGSARPAATNTGRLADVDYCGETRDG